MSWIYNETFALAVLLRCWLNVCRVGVALFLEATGASEGVAGHRHDEMKACSDMQWFSDAAMIEYLSSWSDFI